MRTRTPINLTPVVVLSYRVVPASDPRNVYAAGGDENWFETVEEAEAAVESLRALGGEFDVEWIIVDG